MKITSFKSTLVKPEIPTPPEVLSCSACDQFARPVHVRTLYFFGEKSPGANKDAPQVLKSALSKLLVTFYPNAGRVRHKGDGSGDLEIDCNDAGIVFIEASVDITIDDLGGFQPNPLFDKLCPYADHSMPIEEQPAQLLQVTTFACGGFSLGMALHHTVADGISAHNFIVSWTEVVLGKSISVKPVFDHTLLNSAGAPVPPSPPEELILRPQGVRPVAGSRPVKKRVFTFNPDQLKKIKDEANSAQAAGNDRSFSTFEALSAHTWQSIIRAKGLDASEEVKFFTTLDARKRLKPNLPDGYYGNAIIFTSKKSTAGEILSKPLSFSASLVREAVAKMTNENMRSMIAWADAQTESIMIAINTAAGNDVSTAGWFRMPFYDTDFGFGKALFAGPADNPYNGVVLMLPGHIGPGSINIFINLYTEHMEKLENDADFLIHKVIVPVA